MRAVANGSAPVTAECDHRKRYQLANNSARRGTEGVERISFRHRRKNSPPICRQDYVISWVFLHVAECEKAMDKTFSAI